MNDKPRTLTEMSALRLAYLAQKLRPQRDVLGAEPIAVVGMAGHLPGGGDDLEAFWRTLDAGRDALREVPRDRWDIDAYYDPTPGTRGKMYVRRGAFLDGVDRFDPEFFGISPRDAAAIDPQQRLLLEDCWWALERAGLAADRLAGSRTGVYLGLMHVDYNILGVGAGMESRSATLNYLGVAAGRVAHHLGLQGPALALDTACSSSLVAVHLACQALRDGECELALAGGASLMLSPVLTVFSCENRMLAPDGRCKTFDAAADGFVRGEGSGVLVLRRLADALAAGDPVLAVIRGSAAGHDGRSSAMMVPSGQAQARVIRAALAAGGVAPEQVDYLEAHGTGTALGDPIELSALGAVFGPARPSPLWVGSVKTNIGHLEAAAGIAGLIKTILALQHERIPPHLHCTDPTPRVDWSSLPLAIPRDGAPWPRGERPRIAGVSGFGLFGTNAHVLVEEAPPPRPANNLTDRPVHVLTLSARSPEALLDLARAHDDALARLPADAPVADLCHTANVGRSALGVRAWALGEDAGRLRDSLAELRSDPARAPRTAPRGLTAPRPVFLFSGQGSLAPGVGRELFAAEPVFRATLERCGAALAARLGLRLDHLLVGDDPHARLTDPWIAQPALFALQVALAALWRAWGVEPAALLGHSLGEYAAACVAGVFDLEQGLHLTHTRGRLCHDTAPGTMLAIAAAPDDVDAWLLSWPGAIDLAALNGPQDVVVSGRPDAVAELVALLDRLGVRHRTLPMARGYHTPQLDPILPEYRRHLAAVPLAAPRLPVISGLDGQPAGDRLRDPDYWCRQLREPVRFSAGLQALLAAGHTTFLELGPAAVLAGTGRRLAGDRPDLAWLPSLRPAGETRQLLASAAELHARGVAVDWSAVDAPFARRRVLAPTYPFQRARHWLAAPAPGPARAHAPAGDRPHPLLGEELPLAGSDVRRFTARLDARTPAWLADHRVLGRVLLPDAAHVELALAGARALATPLALESLTIERPLILADDVPRTIQVVLTPEGGDAWRFELHAHEDGRRWTRLSHARLAPPDGAPAPAPLHLATVQARCPRSFAVDDFYALLRDTGLDYGPTFRPIDLLRVGEGEALAHLHLPDDALLDLDDHVLHPVLLDGAMQVTAAAFTADEHSAGLADDARPWVPVGLARARLRERVGASAWVHLRRCRLDAPGVLLADLALLDDHGRTLLELHDLQFRRIDHRALGGALAPELREWLFEIEWPRLDPAAPDPTARAPHRWLILAADDDPLADPLARALTDRGHPCTRARELPPDARPDAVLLLPHSDPAHATTHAPSDPHLASATSADPHFASAPHSTAAPHRADSSDPHLDAALAAPHRADSSDPHLDAALATRARERLAATLRDLQALARADMSLQTWLVTRDAVAAADDDPLSGLADAALWGLGRAAMVEHPRLDLRLLDLPARPGDAHLAALVDLLLRPPADNLLALRDDGLRAARLRPSPAHHAPVELRPLRPDATYLITGGLGGLGLETADVLVDRGARRLVLLGRGDPSPAARQRIDDLRARGVAVDLARADITDEHAMRQVLAACPDLRGVVHSAGVLDDALLTQLDRARLDRVCRPKIDGAWLLHRLTCDRPLDLFVLFSSAAALIGVGGQANYVAANTFLDALAHHRRAAGRPALAIDWGAWTGVGMAAVPQRGRRGALPSITPTRGRQLLAALLAGARAQVGVTPIGPALDGLSGSPAHASLFRDLAGPRGARDLRQDLLDELAAAAPERRPALVARYLQGRVAALLGLPQAPALERAPAELGVDSLMAIELKNRVGRELGVDLPGDRLLDGTPLRRLAETLHAALELGPLRAHPAAAPPPPPEGDLEEVLL